MIKYFLLYSFLILSCFNLNGQSLSKSVALINGKCTTGCSSQALGYNYWACPIEERVDVFSIDLETGLGNVIKDKGDGFF